MKTKYWILLVLIISFSGLLITSLIFSAEDSKKQSDQNLNEDVHDYQSENDTVKVTSAQLKNIMGSLPPQLAFEKVKEFLNARGIKENIHYRTTVKGMNAAKTGENYNQQVEFRISHNTQSSNKAFVLLDEDERVFVFKIKSSLSQTNALKTELILN